MNNPQSGFLGARGVNVRVAKQPFWKPSNKKQYVVLVDVREPLPHEEKRAITDPETGEERVLTFVLLATVKHEGIEKRWEMTSSRCAQALNRLPTDTKLPIWLSVQMVGKGKDTDFVIKTEAPPENQARIPSGNTLSDEDMPHDEKDAITRR